MVPSISRAQHSSAARKSHRPGGEERLVDGSGVSLPCAGQLTDHVPIVRDGRRTVNQEMFGKGKSVMAVAVAAQAGHLAGNHRPAVLLDLAVVAPAETADGQHVGQGDADHAEHHEQDNDPEGQVVFQ
jgi:hypothetical protein